MQYNLSSSFVEISYPWSSKFYWDRSNIVNLEGCSYLLIKLAAGILQNAESAPLIIFKPTVSGLINLTDSLLPNASKYAITRNLLIADLNRDGYDDFFLSNQGPEPISGQFPGEPNAIYIYKSHQIIFGDLYFGF